MRNHIKDRFSFLLTLTLTLTLFFPHLGAQTKTGTGQSYEYQIGAKDLLEISVFEVPELNITVRVSENGMISLPLLGEVQGRGAQPRRPGKEDRLHAGEELT